MTEREPTTERRSFLYYEELLLDAHRAGAREELGADATAKEIETLALKRYLGPEREADDDEG